MSGLLTLNIDAGKEDGSVAMEELCLLLRLAAHVLADSGEGETPLMPLSMVHASHASADAGQVCPFCQLCVCVCMRAWSAGQSCA